MVTSRSLKFGLALTVLTALIGAPAMKCLSAFNEMDMQEMACCAHMSGCDMGAGRSSCCQTVSDPSFASATSPTRPVSLENPAMVGLSPVSTDNPPSLTATPVIAFDDGKPPGGPPLSETVLRI